MAMTTSMVPSAAQAPAAGTDAVATLAAPADGSRWVIGSVAFSYSNTPTDGQLVITYNNQTSAYPISAAGAGMVVFPATVRAAPNSAVTITLKSGGASVKGTVYPRAWTEL